MATDLTNLAGQIYLATTLTATGTTLLPESVATDAINWSHADAVVFGATYDSQWTATGALAKLASVDIDLQNEDNSFGQAVIFTSISNLIIKNATPAATIATYFKVLVGASQATWVATDVVRNKTGAGDDWTGTISHKVDNDNFVILLTTGTYATVANADDIENTTRAQDTTMTKSLVVDPVLKVGVAAGTPADLWLSTTENEWIGAGGYTAHSSGTTPWAVAAGSNNLKIENLGLIPAEYDIIICGSSA